MVLLDTNALLFLLTMPHRLGKKTKRLLSRSDLVHYSPLSAAELAIKQMIGKLKLDEPIHRFIPGQRLREVPFDGTAVAEIYSLPSLARHEPFDRMILATARAHGAKLLTSDSKMLELGFDWILDSSK